MQGPVFSDKEPWSTPCLPAFPGSRRDQKEKVYKGDQPEMHPEAARPWLPESRKGVACLLSACQVGKQLWCPNPICCAQRIMPAYRVTEDESIDLNK